MKLRAGNRAFTTLVADINASVTEFTLDDASNFPSSGTGPFIATINDERILVASRVGNVCTVATTGGTLGVNGRGYDGSAAASHDLGDTVSNKVTAAYVNNLWDELSVNSSGGSIGGDLTITGDLTVEGDASILGDITLTGSSQALDMAEATIKNAVFQSYVEKHVSVTPSTDKTLTLDLEEGNVFYATLSGEVDELVIDNPSTVHTNSLTLEMLLTADYSSAHYFAWQTPATIADASTIVSASTVDRSFNGASAFTNELAPGDIVTVTGFSTAAAANNDSWRVKSATVNKVVVVDDDDELVGVAAGSAITMTRRKEMFVGTVVPDFPEPYIPKTFTMYSKDGVRWKVVEVGEF